MTGLRIVRCLGDFPRISEPDQDQVSRLATHFIVQESRKN